MSTSGTVFSILETVLILGAALLSLETFKKPGSHL